MNGETFIYNGGVVVYESDYENTVKKVVISRNVNHVLRHVFCFWQYLSRVDFSSSTLIEIEDFAFYCCNRLEKVIFPPTLKLLGRNCFFTCENLKTVEFLGNSLRRIGNNCFLGCRNLVDFIVPKLSPNLIPTIIQDVDMTNRYSSHVDNKFRMIGFRSYYPFDGLTTQSKSIVFGFLKRLEWKITVNIVKKRNRSTI